MALASFVPLMLQFLAFLTAANGEKGSRAHVNAQCAG
jgi:hypothetical protein